MRPRNQRLRQALKKFTAETLKPLNLDELSLLMKAFPPDLTSRLSRSLLANISESSLSEFDRIIDKYQLTPKLDALDELSSRATGFDLDMSALEFQPADPEIVKQGIINRAKRGEIDRLEKILAEINRENAALEQMDVETREQLRQANLQIDRQLGELL
jgi:hypothetical protein